MALSVPDIWKLLQQSKLLTQEQCQHLSIGFSALPGSSNAPGKTLAEWLVRQNVVSKYQAIILLAGRAGPFFYGDYKIYDRLDSGRLSGAFRAVHAGTNHPVLLKFLAAGSTAQTPQGWAELQRWIPATLHPNIARCHEAVDLGSYKFVVFEDLRGQSVAELLERSKRIPPDEASRLGRLAALGLAGLHENGRVHGDIRPHNLWLEQTGNLKLLIDPESGTRSFSLLTAANEVDGLARADYAAPEFLQPGRAADPLVDIYAMGCTLYQMIAGQPPFAGGDAQSKLQRHATEAIKPLESVGAPSALTQVVAYSMAKNPSVRFQRATILSEQLVPFIGGAQQKIKAASPLATQAAFEQALQQREVLAAPRVAQAAASAPGFAAPAATATAVAVASVAAVSVASPVSVAAKPSAASAAIRRRSQVKKRNNLIFLGFSILAVSGAVVGFLFFMNSQPASIGKEKSGPTPNTGTANGAPPGDGAPVSAPNPTREAPNAVPNAVVSAPAVGPVTVNLVQDDGQSLWASPTAGKPIQLKYVPPGAQLFSVVRPAAMLSDPEGERVVKALGPRFESSRQAWETAAGVKLQDVEQLIVALYSDQGRPPKSAFVVRLAAEASPESLQAKWGTTMPVDGLPGVVQNATSAFYMPPDDKQTFVMGPLDPEFKDASAAGWKTPLLRREIGQLLQVSDDQRLVTVLFAPNFLFGDGQELFAGELSRSMRPLEWFLGTGLKSGLISLHLSDHSSYFEMRMESDIQTDRYQLAKQVRERMAEIPGKIESYIAELNPHPYWRLVAFRYPAMVHFFHQHTRIGVDGNHAVLNSALPSQAAHNLIFGGEMVIASVPGMVVAAAPSGSGKPAVPKSIEELLKAKISIGFAQDSLEFSMQNIVTEAKGAYPDLPFDFQIKILGTDLEKDGITRNQQVRDFNHKDKPVAEILTAMVMKANPITTVKAPNEADQKLVWVVGASPDNPAQQIVLITTRAAAAQKKYTLPEVFRPK